MITLYNYPEKNINALTVYDSYWEIVNEEKYNKVLKEYILLKDNCIKKLENSNGYILYNLFDTLGIKLAINKREHYLNMLLSIKKMKEFLGVWYRNIKYKAL